MANLENEYIPSLGQKEKEEEKDDGKSARLGYG